MLSDSKESLYETQIENIITGARNWATKNVSILPEEEGELITITLGQLKNSGDVVVDIRDPRTKELFPNDMEITITRHLSNYVYNVDVETGGRNIGLDVPYLILKGETLKTVEINSNYEEEGVIALGLNGNDITSEIVITITKEGDIVSSIDTSDFYEYKVHYSVEDEGIENSIIRTVKIVDTTPPELTLPPDSSMLSSEVSSFNELAGVTTTDNSNKEPKLTVDGDVSVDPGVYKITYTSEDSKGNKTVKVRTITVIDDLGPTISFDPVGGSDWKKSHSTKVTVTDPSGILEGSLYYVWSNKASGVNEEDFQAVFTSGSTITNNTLTGDYYLWVIAKDRNDNIRIKRSEMFRLDNTEPELSIPGNATITVQQVGNYNLLNGVSYSDTPSGVEGTVIVSGNVPSIPGNYTITYKVKDKAGNETVRTRVITVQDK